MSNIVVRAMTHMDTPAAAKIELDCGGETFGVDRWKMLINNRDSIAIMAFNGIKPCGISLAARDRKRILLMSLMVAGYTDEFRDGFRCEEGCKAAALMMTYIKSRLKLANYRESRIVAEVDEKNLPAQKFFRSQQLEAVKIIDAGEDATYYRMVWRAKVFA